MEAELTLTWEEQAEARHAAYLEQHPVPASATNQALAALSYQVMEGQQTIAQNQDTITALQQSNAQIAYQLMTQQGGTA